MKANKLDQDKKELYVGDLVEFDGEKFEVKYGNFMYLGTERIGFYIEQLTLPKTRMPLTNKVKKL